MIPIFGDVTIAIAITHKRSITPSQMCMHKYAQIYMNVLGTDSLLHRITIIQDI